MDSSGNQTITRSENYKNDDGSTTTIETTHVDGVTTVETTHTDSEGNTTKETTTDGNVDDGGDTSSGATDGTSDPVDTTDSGGTPAPADESTPDPEGGGVTTKAGKKAKAEGWFDIGSSNPFEPTGGRGGIMRPEDDGTVFDEERTVPVSLEQALEQRLDPWINPVDDIQGGGGSYIDELKPKHMDGDPIDPDL